MMRYKYLLDESELPTHWYNVVPDMKTPPPPYRHPVTLDLLQPDDLASVFPQALIEQETSQDSWIPIPEQVRDILKMWRPTPLYRAARWERALETPARIYYKWEGVSPPGSHKPNTAVAQAYYAREEGLQGLATETGAGQWGSALAFATQMFGLACKIFMVAISYQQKPYRRIAMETWGGHVVPSPSKETQAGRNVLAVDPDTSGSLGISISEAMEYAVTHDGWKYALGSVVNFVLLHQTIVGQEARKQIEMAGDYPDVLIGCVGGGSNFAGLFLPFLRDKLSGERPDLRVINVESTACPSLTRGLYAYDWADTAKTGPVTKMYTVGHTFVPAPVHAGGLRYHGMAPIICRLLEDGYVEARAYAHAIKAAYDEALRCRESGKAEVLLIAASGHGHFDLAAYDAYHRGVLEDYALEEERLQKALASLPHVQG